MNPAHTSDQPGLAPCGMKMEPVYADDASATGPPDGGALLPGSVKISLAKQQLIGVRLGLVEQKPLPINRRLLGRVAADETRIYRLLASVDGWVTHAPPFATGSPVKKNETLAAFYSPEFLSAAQALLFALNSRDRVQATGTNDSPANSRVNQFNVNLQQYRDSLHNLGMSNLQIEEVIRTRKFAQNVNLVSPVDGFVATRNLSDGQRFQKGTELFRIVDLSRVWILVDASEPDARHLKVGSPVRVTLPNQGGAFPAVVSDALPQFDAATRTLKVRLEADNADFSLKPDRFVDVELTANLPESLVIPADAVLDAGLRKTVFVDRGNGYFEPQVVQTGERSDGEVQILQGLKPGERVVISGNFLLDSESRMKLAAGDRTMPSGGATNLPHPDPLPLGEGTAAASSASSSALPTKSESRNDNHRPTIPPFPAGAGRGEGEPAKHLSDPNSPTLSNKPADPVCGMTVNESKARAAKRTLDYQGKTWFFCNDGCKDEFAAAPEKFLKPQNLKSEPTKSE